MTIPSMKAAAAVRAVPATRRPQTGGPADWPQAGGEGPTASAARKRGASVRPAASAARAAVNARPPVPAGTAAQPSAGRLLLSA